MTDHQTARRLAALDQVLILTHRRPDGDTIGCASALCLALRQLGKTAWVLPNEDAHGLFTPYLEGVLAPAGFLPQHVVAVDVASLGMLPDSAGAYKDRIDLVIDHHGSNEGYGRETCVDPSCAACGELLYRIFQAMAISFTPEIAMLLYMAIATDTGCFVYSNTTPETHRIAAALMAVGFDAQWVNRRHFRVKSLKRMQLEGRLVQEMELAQGGTLAFAYVTLALIADLQATEEDLEDISSFIGQVEGVDNAVTIRQLSPPGVQNFPAHRRQDPQRLRCLCPPRRGGGHPAAAGCTIWGPPPRPKQPCWPPLSRCSMANGILIIDKPAGWTSHDVVAKLRGLLRERRIGHAGTLDPMATGVLPVFVGRATRAVEFAAEREKEYLAGLRLGVVTDTQDTTGTVLETHPVCADRPQVEAVLARFRGRSPRFPRCTPPSSGRGRSSTSWPGGARRWSGSPGPLPLRPWTCWIRSPPQNTPCGYGVPKGLTCVPSATTSDRPWAAAALCSPCVEPSRPGFPWTRRSPWTKCRPIRPPNSFCCRWTAISAGIPPSPCDMGPRRKNFETGIV